MWRWIEKVDVNSGDNILPMYYLQESWKIYITFSWMGRLGCKYTKTLVSLGGKSMPVRKLRNRIKKIQSFFLC